MSTKFRKPVEEDLKIYFDPNWIHYTASAMPPRPGFALFSAVLEHQFFEPGTPKNEDFKILSTGWHHGSLWMTVTIPSKDKHLAEAVAQYCGIKICDTFPISHKKFPMFATVKMESLKELQAADPDIDPFPLYMGVNIFSLENTDDHPTKNGQMNHQEWHEHEMMLVGKVVGEYKWTDEDEEELKKFNKFMKTGKWTEVSNDKQT